MQYNSTECVWAALPGPCLQAITHGLGPRDTLSARLACSCWANSIPLPHISLSLTVTPAGLSQQAVQRLSSLLQALQHSSSSSNALALAKLLTVDLSPCGVDTGCQRSHDACQRSAPAQQSQGSPTTTTSSSSSSNTAVSGADIWARLLQALPAACSLTVRIHKQQQQQREGAMALLPSACGHVLITSPLLGAAAAGSSVQDCHAVLWQLLAAPALHQRLSSLCLSCKGLWPEHPTLAAALQALPRLSTLQLRNCPLAAITRLPSLPRLQQLSVSGRFLEPVPRSYSVKQLPLLPALPGLLRLQLQQLPYDVQCQEYEDAAALAQQQPQQGVGPRVPPSPAAGGGVVTDWRRVRQWVGESIVQHCPSLQRLQSDMVLGELVLGRLQQLDVLAVPRLALGRGNGRSSCGAVAARSKSAAAPAQRQATAAGTSGGSSNLQGKAEVQRCQHAPKPSPAAVASLSRDMEWRCCRQPVLCSCCS